MNTIFSVVRDMEMYKKCIAENSFCEKFQKSYADNNVENIGIAKRYNDFLDAFDYSNPGWILFCHEDFEFCEDITAKLSACPTDAIYGPCGARHVKYLNLVSRWQIAGEIGESWKDGSHFRRYGKRVKKFTVLDTTDCMCLIVHSSLIQKHNLRFDPQLAFDLYAEDFCIAAIKSNNVKTKVVDFGCIHHSSRLSLPPQYLESLNYLNRKYPDDAFCGTCSYIGGSKIARNFCGPLAAIMQKMV